MSTLPRRDRRDRGAAPTVTSKPGGAVSSHFLAGRARGALAILSSTALLACASGAKKEPAEAPLASRPAADPSIVTHADGKSVEQLFENRFPGVTVARTDAGGLQILVRGSANSFYGGNLPLYVLDDTPLPLENRGVVYLNPNDILKIEVLKNPADLAIYGMRGANGVVKITTKKPGRQ
jgi:TonB-dependent SusC/RagA subfamily outer membrane receptor